MFKEFKEFISRGSALDLAIGVVIGGAFKAIVDSLVADIIMPIVGFVSAGVDFSSIAYVLKPAVMENGEVVSEAITLNFGNLIETIVKFFIIAFVLFLIVKGINRVRRMTEKKEVVEEVEAIKLSEEVMVLQEIRDLLKEKDIEVSQK